MLPNLLKAKPDHLNYQPIDQVISEEEELESEQVILEEEAQDQMIDDFLDEKPIESFDNPNHINGAPLNKKQKSLSKRDRFLFNQNKYYSNCDDDCINKNLIQKYNNIFNFNL